MSIGSKIQGHSRIKTELDKTFSSIGNKNQGYSGINTELDQTIHVYWEQDSWVGRGTVG